MTKSLPPGMVICWLFGPVITMSPTGFTVMLLAPPITNGTVCSTCPPSLIND